MRLLLIFVPLLVSFTSVSLAEFRPIEWARVAHAGNVADPVTGHGKVDYEYALGKYEVTNAQYAEFLNAVAAEADPNGLFSQNMTEGLFGGIVKRTSKGKAHYEVIDGYGDLPVNYVSWFDALRFCNWLHYGKPIGMGQVIGSTEGDSTTGAYDTTRMQTILAGQGREVVGEIGAVRSESAQVWLPNLDEWYKAAYYEQKDASYNEYPFADDGSLVDATGKAKANFYNYRWTVDRPYLTAVGYFAPFPSPYGTYDQGGNVSEWIETDRFGTHRRICGGAAPNLSYSISRRNVDSEYPDHELYAFGFRVAGVATSETMSVVGIDVADAEFAEGGADGVEREAMFEMAFVKVADVKNNADPVYGFGNVDYEFEMGKYEVTCGQYAEFLNAVAAESDPFALYSDSMENGLFGGIDRTKESGRFQYVAKPGWVNRPVVYVSWFDVARLSNWYHFGKPQKGRCELGTTEGDAKLGAYDTRSFPIGSVEDDSVREIQTKRNRGARYWIPSENEWYKAAYFDPSRLGERKYWDYPVKTSNIPDNSRPPGGQHSVNYYDGDYCESRVWTLTVVGVFSDASSYYGTFDQGGNVWEWLEDWRKRDRNGIPVKGVRGGSATYTEIGVHAMNTDPGNPTHEKFIWGARLARSTSERGFVNPDSGSGSWFHDKINRLKSERGLMVVFLLGFAGCFFLSLAVRWYRSGRS